MPDKRHVIALRIHDELDTTRTEYFVVNDMDNSRYDVHCGPFASEAEAWAWIDRRPVPGAARKVRAA